MAGTDAPAFQAERANLGARTALLLALVLACLAPALASHDLWAPDEPRYARVSQELLDRGAVALLTVNGEPYSQKPPLQFWLTALWARAFTGGEVGPVTARLTSLLAGLALVWLTARLGQRLTGDPAVAWLAAAVLASSFRFMDNATTAHLDALLAALALCAVVDLLRNDLRPGVLFWLLVGLGALTKGPVILLLVGSAALPWCWAARRWRPFAAPRSLAGAALAGVLFGAWVLAALAEGGAAFRHDLLVGQTLDRMTSGYSHPNPVWYYVPTFAAEFLPWSLLVPGALLWAWSRHRAGGEFDRAAMWFGLGFLLFSLVREKRGLYLLPLYPPAALLVARFVVDGAAGLLPERLRRWGLVAPLGATCILLLLTAVVVPGLKAAAPLGPAGPTALRLALAPLAVAALAALAILGRRRSPTFAAACLTLGMLFTVGLAKGTVFPLLDPLKSASFICASAASGWTGPIGMYGFYTGAYSYHLRRNLPVTSTPDALRAWLLTQPGPVRLLCVEEVRAALESTASALGRPVRTVDRRPVGHRTVAVVEVGAKAP